MKKPLPIAILFSIISLLVFYAIVNVNSNQNESQNIILKPTYDEGFGVVFKKELLIKRISSDIPENIHIENKEILYFITDPKNEDKIIVIKGFSTFVQEDLEKAFNETESVKLQAICYESIVATGMPSEGNSISTADDFTLPSGPGWTIQNMIYILSFKNNGQS